MLSIEEIRKTLPDGGKDLSDEQVAKLSADMYALADICFDMWLADRNKKIKEVGVESTQTTTKASNA